MPVFMENQDISESGSRLPFDDLSASDYDFDMGHSLDNDTSLCEKFLLDEVESYWDDLNSRLTISRMVSDSVIKGIINAIEAEAAERVASKEEELLILNKKMQLSGSDMVKEDQLDEAKRNSEISTQMVEPLKSEFGFYQFFLCKSLEHKCIAHLKESVLVTQDYLRRLKEDITIIRDTHVLCNTKDFSADKDFCRILDQKLIAMDGFVDALKVAIAAMHREFGDTCLSLKILLSEQEWEQNFQREISDIIVQNLTMESQIDFESNISKQNNLVDRFTKNWKETIGHLSTMRQELDGISSSLLSSESGLVVANHNPPDLAKRAIADSPHELLSSEPGLVISNHNLPDLARRTISDSLQHDLLCSEPGLVVSHHCPPDIAKITIADSPQLKHLSKDEQIAYYKTEIARMKIQHELALHEKTEEFFSLKRDYLKEKGHSGLHYKKYKEIEVLRKKIIGFISTLDNILLEKEKLSIVQSHKDMLHSVNKRFDILMFENQQLKSLLIDRAKEVSGVTSEGRNGLSLRDSLDHRKWMELDVEDLQSDTIIRDKIHKIVLGELVGKLKDDMEYLDFKCKIEQDICFTLCREYISDVILSLNTSLEKHYKEQDSFAAAVVEKEKALSLERQGHQRLKQEKEMLTTLIDEKEKLLAETVVELTEQKEHNDKVCHEVSVMKQQLGSQSLEIIEYKKENASMKEKLAETLKQLQQYQSELRGMNKEYNVASDALKELEKQKMCLDDLVAEKQVKLASAIAKEREHIKFVQTLMIHISNLSESIVELECRFANKLGTTESRLEFLSHQCSDILQQVTSLITKACRYRQGFERKCSDLQKAETEVDLLGDEVDVLLRLLEKIYIALEHYSPVLQHYPGVVEILKVIRRELKSNTI